MPIFNQAAALTTSKSAIGVGICFTVGDAVVQYFVHKVELQVSPRPPAAADPPAARPDGPRRPGSPTPPEYAWDTGRTYCAFVVGSTLGITVTAVKMLVQGSPWQGLLASVLPAELMLLPFQAIACTGHSDHFARNLPGYMMLLTLVQLVVGYPTLIWGLVAPKNELLTGLPTLIATEVQELLLGFSAVGIFIFANRYPEKQWVMPLVGDTTDLMAHCNQPLIVIGQVLGNASWVVLTLYVVLNNSQYLSSRVLLPLLAWQMVVNTQQQMVEEEELMPVGIRMIRVFLPMLTIPASHITGLPKWETSFGLLALSSYTLWIGSFLDEWRLLYDAVEGPRVVDDKFILDTYLDSDSARNARSPRGKRSIEPASPPPAPQGDTHVDETSESPGPGVGAMEPPAAPKDDTQAAAASTATPGV